MSTKIGITGGIGSGKSIVSRLLEIMGVPVYISDIESKRITCIDEYIIRELSALVGEGILVDGELNRSLLAAYLFGHPDHTKAVNAIIHPRVKDDFRKWAACRDTYDLIGIESAILVEASFREEVDYVVMVYAPLHVRVDRAVRRDGALREQIMKRIDSQMSDEEKRGHADFVLINDGETPLIPQVLNLISLLSKNNSYLCPAKNNSIKN